jgi:Flp pilus assembly protein TadG
MNPRLRYLSGSPEACRAGETNPPAAADTRRGAFVRRCTRSLNHLRAIAKARRSQSLVSRGRAGAQRHQDRVDRDMTPFFGRLLTLRRDERAATAVEFAILATPLFALILGSLQLSIIFYAGQMLQTGLVHASRELMTGASQQANETQLQYKNDVCGAPTIQLLFNCSNIVVDVQSASSYAALGNPPPPVTITYNTSGQPNPNQGAYAPGTPGEIVIVRVLYNWPVIAAPLFPGLANQSNGTHLLVATNVFKTEPY